MATYSGWGFDESFKAATDLSAKAFYFVKAGSVAGEVSLATGASLPYALGVLMHNPKAGDEATVRIMGIAKVSASAALGSGAASAIAQGDFLIAGSNGLAYKMSGSVYNAVALEAVASGTGAVIKALLMCPTGRIA